MDVTVYGTPTCPWCDKAKEFLKEKGVDFKYVDVSADPRAAEEMVKKSGQMGVPVVIIGDKVIVGFEKELIEESLSK